MPCPFLTASRRFRRRFFEIKAVRSPIEHLLRARLPAIDEDGFLARQLQVHPEIVQFAFLPHPPQELAQPIPIGDKIDTTPIETGRVKIVFDALIDRSDQGYEGRLWHPMSVLVNKHGPNIWLDIIRSTAVEPVSRSACMVRQRVRREISVVS